jgi:hypothetical protein
MTLPAAGLRALQLQMSTRAGVRRREADRAARPPRRARTTRAGWRLAMLGTAFPSLGAFARRGLAQSGRSTPLDHLLSPDATLSLR